MAKVCVVKVTHRADVRAVKVDHAHEADLLVFVEKNGGRALGDARWFYVGSEFQCTTKLLWVDQDDGSALKVFFVDDEAEAGWTKGHAMQGRL